MGVEGRSLELQRNVLVKIKHDLEVQELPTVSNDLGSCHSWAQNAPGIP